MGKSSSVSNFSIERILSLPSRQHRGKDSSNTHSSSTSSSSSLPLPTATSSPHILNSTPFFSSSKHQVKLPPIALTAPLPVALAAYNSHNNSRIHHRHTQNKTREANRSTASLTGALNSSSSSSLVAAAAGGTTTSSVVVVPPTTKSKNAKKYKCDLCGRGFSRSNTLITHRVLYYFY